MNIKRLLLGTFLLGATLSGNAQLLLSEQFEYGTTADTLTNPAIGGLVWKRHSGTGGPLQYVTTSLSYTGYPGNGAGGAVAMAHASTSREDANRALSAPVSTGNVFISFLLNVTASGGATGDYSFHLNDSSGNTISSTFRAKMFFKDGGTPGTFKLGFAKGAAVTAAVFSPTDYAVNQTYMVVVKYAFKNTSTNDDSLYASVVSSGVPAAEPAVYDIVCTDITQSDLAKVKSVCIRQGTVGTGAATFDGIRVATDWADLTTSSPNAPSAVSAFAFNTTEQTTSTLSWTKPGDYVDTTMTTLIFLKQGSAVTQGTPNANPGAYAANADASIGGTAYQNDAVARCVSKGDALSVNLTGLTPNTTYYALAYVVRDLDSAYSAGVTASAVTKPTGISMIPVANLAFKYTTQTTTSLTWTKDSTYNNDSLTTLVFIKATTPITQSLTSTDPHFYTADPNVAGSGTPFVYDPDAKCAYNGDLDSVNLTGLTPGTTYYAMVFTVLYRTDSSMYSLPKLASVTSLFPPNPLYAIGQINTVNPTTGIPDSLNVRVKLRGTVYGFNQLSTAGVQFVLRDATGGTTVYSPAKNFGYTVTEGDSIEVSGQVNTYRGLHETDRLDTIIFLGTAAPARPVVVTTLNESTENNLIRLNGVRFDTVRTGNWPIGNLAIITPLGETLTIRVLATSALAGKPLPAATTFDVTGLGSQFTTTPANFNGYQIYPRSEDDISYTIVIPGDSLSPFDLMTPANNDTITVTNTNMADSVYIIWTMSTNSNGVDLPTYTFELDTAGGDFSGSAHLEFPAGISNVLPFTKSDIFNLMVLKGVTAGQTYAGIWRVKAESDGLLRYSTSTFNIFLKNRVTTGISEQQLADQIRMYPNPSHDRTVLSGLSSNDLITLSDMTGKVAYTTKATGSELTIPTLNMPSGVYFVKVQSGNAIAVKKLVIQ